MMAGLPGAGKSSLAQAIASRLGAVLLSVDPIEDAMLRSGLPMSFETGLAAYEVGATLATTQLRIGLTVVADAANDLEVGRDMWRRAAADAGAAVTAIEVVCSDPDLHRRRLAERDRGMSHYPEPSWDDVVRRAAAFEPWPHERLVVDSVRPLGECLEVVLGHLRG